MKVNAKQLTFLSFSIIASAIISIHAFVFLSTAEDMERLYAENRLDRIGEYLRSSLERHDIQKQPMFLLQTQGKANFDPYIQVYFDSNLIPKTLNIPENLALGVALETIDNTNHKTYFVLKHNFGPSYGIAYLVLDNSFYELIEESLPTSHTKQLLMSAALLIISLLVILKMSVRLTSPISKLAEDLSNRSAQNIEPMALPQGMIPTEIEQLITSFNEYQERINQLVERERSFNRYASHELRTPLMVIKGAISLLGESTEPAFVEKQRQRLIRATEEMNAFIQTLLSLTKLPTLEDSTIHEITESDITNLVDNHSYLLRDKKVSTHIHLKNNLQILMPKAAFNILIGNLIKNAFANTFTGNVDILINAQTIQISDSGIGLQDNKKTDEGYGLGLLLVKDICKQFSCKFQLTENEMAGCTAQVIFPSVNSELMSLR